VGNCGRSSAQARRSQSSNRRQRTRCPPTPHKTTPTCG
jgi:hypothetical protein